MKTIEFTKYGSTDDLQSKEVEKPTPKKNEVLVKIHAASINSWDWELLNARPFANRLIFGLFRPKRLKTLGFDIAGNALWYYGEGHARGKVIITMEHDSSN